ncbi:hypothetical protein F9K73_13565 [Brucella intermedia]|uniref:hypothetical protein n=1 Tax=Brucella intermedia TaxID=94625 RepID=UPI00124C837A|nr:hypothetical protein [Brucella intermedia]KAB2720941.1 hypothetical protein F9K73_13565 [Brucella intermedia]
MADIDPAHVLFPSDAPKLDASLDFNGIAKGAAEARLTRRTEPDAANVFPGDAAKPDQTAGQSDDDIAEKLFGDTSKADYDKLMEGELDQYALNAIQNGDKDRADALKYATSALADDMRAAGTDASDLKEAFEIVRHSAGMVPPTHEQREASFNEGLTAVQQAGISDADLSAARAFIRDLETVSPGVVASLNAHGAGNDIRLIRKAVVEARRRGY